MIPPDQLAIPDKKYLHNCILIPEVLTVIHCHCDNIPILLTVTGDLLTLADLLNTSDQIPVLHGILIPHLLRSFLHFFHKFINSVLKITIQKTDHTVDISSVFFLADISLAGSLALLHMIVQTGPVFSGISWQIPVAGAHLIQLSHKLDHVFHRTAACIRTKVSGLVFFHPPGKKYSGIRLMNRYLDKRIALVVL